MRDEQEMKYSGVEYLGFIPNDWKVASAKYFVKISNGSDPKSEGDIPVYGSGKKSFRTCGEYKEGPAVLLGRKGTIDIPQYIDGRYWNVDTAFDVKNKSGYSLRYYYYLSTCFDYKRYSTQTALPSMTQSNYTDMRITLPIYFEQQHISNYLDDRCSKIDAIIAEAKASIEEYKELKQAVIYEAVTKGLDKNVEMKDSGVEWVEKIPNNWHIVKITRILDKEHPYAIGDGDHGSIKTEQYRDSGIPFIRVQNLGWGTALNMDNVVYISEEDNKQIQNSTLRPNDILFAKTGATIGKTAIMPEEIPIANTTSHVGKISISKEHNSRYIFYVLSSQIGYRQFWDIAIQKTTRPELSIEETKSIKVVLPADKTIEDSIVNYLDEKIPVFDDMINTKASLIEDLEAYKKSLIYEVVTGKRKVVA